jgi:hypothetical protein
MTNEKLIVIKYKNKYVICNDKNKAEKIIEDLKEIDKEADKEAVIEEIKSEKINKLIDEGKAIYDWEFYMDAATEDRDYGFVAYCHHCGEHLGGFSVGWHGRKVVECECGAVNVIENPYYL